MAQKMQRIRKKKNEGVQGGPLSYVVSRNHGGWSEGRTNGQEAWKVGQDTLTPDREANREVDRKGQGEPMGLKREKNVGGQTKSSTPRRGNRKDIQSVKGRRKRLEQGALEKT